MNTYKCFYRQKPSIEVDAETILSAQEKAAKFLKAKKSYEVATILVAINGKKVVTTITD